MYRLFCRMYQSVYRVVAYFLPWRQPLLLEGENSLLQLPGRIKSMGIQNLLLITDKGIVSFGLIDGLLNGLQEEGIAVVVYDKTVPNPTIDNIEEALKLYKENGCTGIAAFGGGSSMDCAKGVGARVARPDKAIPQLKGQLKVHKKLPPLFAIPTTAGTGSETTLAAVVTDSRTHEKYAINDTALIPLVAVLDPILTVKLPPGITATTGMDALTHAVEAYIGKSNTKATREQAREAVALIFQNVYEAYSNGGNIDARARMQKASFLAGLAFTRAYVGYVHAIAHTLGGFYSIAHGLANAVILPYVLEYFGESAEKPLAELADVAGIGTPGDSVRQKSRLFIQAIKDMNKKMGIPEKISGIKDSDIALLAGRALAEGNPLYPVPKIITRTEMEGLYRLIKE